MNNKYPRAASALSLREQVAEIIARDNATNYRQSPWERAGIILSIPQIRKALDLFEEVEG